MRVQDLKKLTRYTVVEIGWADTCEEPTGDPRASFVVLRRTLGYVWGVKRDKKTGTQVLTLSFTTDEDGPEQSGWICIPVSNVKELEIVRKKVGHAGHGGVGNGPSENAQEK